MLESISKNSTIFNLEYYLLQYFEACSSFGYRLGLKSASLNFLLF